MTCLNIVERFMTVIFFLHVCNFRIIQNSFIFTNFPMCQSIFLSRQIRFFFLVTHTPSLLTNSVSQYILYGERHLLRKKSERSLSLRDTWSFLRHFSAIIGSLRCRFLAIIMNSPFEEHINIQGDETLCKIRPDADFII